MSQGVKERVARSLAEAPIIGVVRTTDRDLARAQAEALRDGGLELIEITFTCPGATELVTELLSERGGDGPPWIGMGTVTGSERARAAMAAGAEFVVTPNAHAGAARVAVEAGRFLVVGALTCTEIVAARDLGADIVKVYPLPPVGGAAYLATVRQPLDDIPMLAAGGFPPEEIPAYRKAGARAYGIGSVLLGSDLGASAERIHNALALARGEDAE